MPLVVVTLFHSGNESDELDTNLNLFLRFIFRLFLMYVYLYTLLEKYQSFFCENLVVYNESRLHEATLNIETHA